MSLAKVLVGVGVDGPVLSQLHLHKNSARLSLGPSASYIINWRFETAQTHILYHRGTALENPQSKRASGLVAAQSKCSASGSNGNGGA